MAQKPISEARKMRWSADRNPHHWMKHFAFRQNPRQYEDHELLGHVALVVDVEPTYIRFVTHSLHRVEVIELMKEDFFAMFTMDPILTPLRSAHELRQAKNIMTVVPPATEVIEQHISTPPSLEDFVVKNQPTSKAAKAVQKTAKVCCDFNRRTCIEIERKDGKTYYIPLASTGLDLESLDEKDFDGIYKLVDDYPAEKAAKLYAEYAQHLGASKEAMQQLAKLVPILDKEIQMATAKKATNAAVKAAKTPVPAKKAPAAKKTAAKSAPSAKTPAVKTPKVAAGDKKPSAASRFQELIMEGKLSDSAIFAKVQAEFGLDDKKITYVKWYRNHLEKQGKKPPAAKAEK